MSREIGTDSRPRGNILQRLQTRLTLFPKYFASFPHGTCLLSGSISCWASDHIYDQICAPISGSATLWVWAVRAGTHVLNGVVTLLNVLSKNHTRAAALAVDHATTHQFGDQVLSASNSIFIRHYLRNPMWFLFLHLLICLNSVSSCSRGWI